MAMFTRFRLKITILGNMLLNQATINDSSTICIRTNNVIPAAIKFKVRLSFAQSSCPSTSKYLTSFWNISRITRKTKSRHVINLRFQNQTSAKRIVRDWYITLRTVCSLLHCFWYARRTKTMPICTLFGLSQNIQTYWAFETTVGLLNKYWRFVTLHLSSCWCWWWVKPFVLMLFRWGVRSQSHNDVF